MRASRGVSEVLGALLILAITLTAGVMLYAGLRREISFNVAGVSEGSRLLSQEARTMITLVDARINGSSTLILLYNYGETARILKVITASGPSKFMLRVYSEGRWVDSPEGVIPSESLVLLTVYATIVNDRVILRLEGDVDYVLHV